MNADQLAPDEPLSPELVLVFSPELRAQALARLEAPVRARPRLHVPEHVRERVPEQHVGERVLEYLGEPVATNLPTEVTVPFREPFVRSLGAVVAGRVVQLALIFVAVTIFTLAMSLAAHAFR